jgi:Fe-S oxidoreductase
VQAANAISKTKFARRQMDSVLGVHPDAWMPKLATKRFRWSAAKSAAAAVTNGQRTPGKVATFATCDVNDNEPGIGHDLLKVLAHNDIPYVIVDKESCCGMPQLEPGALDAVAKHKAANMPVLARYASRATPSSAPCPAAR